MKRKTLVTAVTVLLLVAIALPVGAQTVWSTFTNLRTKQLDVLTTSTLRGTTTVPSGGSLVIANGATLTTNGYVTGDVTTLNVSGESKLTGATWVTGTLNAADNAAVGGNFDVTGNMDVADYLSVSGSTYFISGDAWTVTDGSVITPTGTVMELTAAGTVGAELTGCGDGQLLILVNTANQTITISETTEFRSAGNFAMGQYDTMTIMGVGVKCYELARSNN